MTIYIHIPKEKRMELKPFGKKGIFVGDKVSHIEIDSEDHKGPKNYHTFQLFILNTITRTR